MNAATAILIPVLLPGCSLILSEPCPTRVIDRGNVKVFGPPLIREAAKHRFPTERQWKELLDTRCCGAWPEKISIWQRLFEADRFIPVTSIVAIYESDLPPSLSPSTVIVYVNRCGEKVRAEVE